MAKGIVRIDRLKPRYRWLYLAPNIVGLATIVFPGTWVVFELVDRLNLAGDHVGVGLVVLAASVMTFMVFYWLTVGILILVRQLSAHDGWRLMSGRGVPTHWYRW